MSKCVCVFAWAGNIVLFILLSNWLGHLTHTLFFIYYGKILTIESYFHYRHCLLPEIFKAIEISRSVSSGYVQFFIL